MQIRFGVCASIDNAKLVADAGYDYLEYSFQALAAMTDEEFEDFRTKLEASGLKAEAYNGFFPATIPLTGENVDMDVIAAHAEKGFSRASLVGGKVAVLGSGAARKIPEGFDYDTAYAQFAKVLDLCGTLASKYGMEVALEPLNTGETNLINTVAEGMELCRKVNNPGARCLADFFHVFKSGETLDAIETAGEMLNHVHLARPNIDRGMPLKEDLPAVKRYAEALKKCGYCGRLSLEGALTPDFETAIRRTRPILDLFNE